jgi:low affinity Fe/Cu permease
LGGDPSRARYQRQYRCYILTRFCGAKDQENDMPNFTRIFDKVAQWTSQQCGRPPIFAGACGVVILWAVSGPVFHYSDTWQLVINTGTTIITFLMVFLIQNSQNRDSHAMQIKLDELIRATKGARERLLNLEDLSDDEMAKIKADLVRIAQRAKEDPDHLSID